jgi:EAL domain-containing protein (putative c-di-GMP-specific phosphodiesterase class I)/GGDEF domain-containing protein
MDLNSHIFSGIRWFAALFIFLGFSLPVNAAVSSGDIGLLSITFVFGLTFAAVLVLSLVQKISLTSAIYLLLSAGSLSLLVYAISAIEQQQLVIVLSSATVYLLMVSLWSLRSKEKSEAKNLPLIKSALLAISIGNLVVIWFFPKIDAYNLWLIISGAMFMLVVYGYKKSVKQAEQSNSKLSMLAVALMVFIVAIYLWLMAQINSVSLFVAGLASFVLIVSHYVLTLEYENKSNTQTEEHIVGEPPLTLQSSTTMNDPATNLPTYQQVIQVIDTRLKQHNEKQLAVIVFKPVNFQQVNAVLGHHNSDILLLQFAYSLQQKLVDNELLLNFAAPEQPVRVARLQSLNFIVVIDLSLSHHPADSLIKEACLQLSAAVPDAISFKSFSLNFELKFGVAKAPIHGNNIAEVIAYAGDALLTGEQSQQQINYFDSDSIVYAEQQLRKMEQLKQDIADHKLAFYLQPQIGISDRRFKGFELLVHWYCQGEVPLELEEFIATAEYSGEVYLLTKQMIEQAFKALFKLQKLGVYQTVSINLSSKDLLEPDLVDYIEVQIKKYSIPAKYLLIELTEDVMLTATDQAKIMIDQLRALEIGISIDQFTGSYESLRYLRKMAIDQVKIDCSYLANSTDNHADKAIVNALINLTRSMKLPFIGTGIKTKEIEESFQTMGGEFAQGQTISKGVTLTELEVWLESWFEHNPQAKQQ